MKRSKQKLIHQMEVQDDLGIKRNVKKSFLNMPIKSYFIIKLVTLCSIPLVYFICSPLLVFVITFYFLLIFVTNAVEKSNNAGLKKEFHIKLPKVDSILCLLLIILAIVGTIVSSTSMSQKKGMFNGFSEEQISEIEDFKFDGADFKWMQFKNKIVEFGNLKTGTRYFFKEEKKFGGFGGGKPDFDFDFEKMGAPPDGFTPPNGDKPDFNKSMSDMPFEMVFQQIVKAIASGMVAIIVIAGIISIIKLKKIEKTL